MCTIGPILLIKAFAALARNETIRAMGAFATRARLHTTLQSACPQWAARFHDMEAQLERMRIVEPGPHKPVSNETSTEADVSDVHLAVTAIMEADPTHAVPWGQLRNLRVALLSAIFATSAHLSIHVQTIPSTYAAVERMLLDLRHAVSMNAELSFCFRIYCVDLEALAAEVYAHGFSANLALFARTLLPLQLTHLRRVLVLDTDVVIVSDLRILWQSADTWLPKSAIGMAKNFGGDSAGSHNSGVVVLDLDKMRQPGWLGVDAGWMDAIWRVLLESHEYRDGRERAVSQRRLPQGASYIHAIGFVEQKVFSWIGNERSAIETLAPAWNLEMCDWHNRRIRSLRPHSIGALHMNCMKGTLDGCVLLSLLTHFQAAVLSADALPLHASLAAGVSPI